MNTKIELSILTGVAASALFLASNIVTAQDMPGPGPEHEALKKFVGEWEAKVKSIGGEESTGVVTYELKCGGLWLASDFQGQFGGMKFEGHGLDGYDPIKKKYVSVWVDSMSPRPLFFEGEMDPLKKTLTMFAEGPGPDGQVVKFKAVTHLRDDDHMDFKMYIVEPVGDPTEMMSIAYERKK